MQLLIWAVFVCSIFCNYDRRKLRWKRQSVEWDVFYWRFYWGCTALQFQRMQMHWVRENGLSRVIIEWRVMALWGWKVRCFFISLEMVEGSLHKGLAMSFMVMFCSRHFSMNTLLSRVKCFWLPGIKLDIKYSFPGTRIIRIHYKTKWNFCKT